jgi:hypothetical protein
VYAQGFAVDDVMTLDFERVFDGQPLFFVLVYGFPEVFSKPAYRVDADAFVLIGNPRFERRPFRVRRIFEECVVQHRSEKRIFPPDIVHALVPALTMVREISEFLVDARQNGIVDDVCVHQKILWVRLPEFKHVVNETWREITHVVVQSQVHRVSVPAKLVQKFMDVAISDRRI